MSEVRYHSGPSEERRRTEDARRAKLLDDVREIEAMTDTDLDLEIVVLSKTIDDITIDVMANNEGATNRGSTWKIAAEKRISAFRWRRKLCVGEQTRRTAAAKAQRALEERERRPTDETKAERQRAHAEWVAATMAAKAERIARHAEEDKTTHATFVRHAKAMLPPETVRALWAAVHAELRQPKEPNP